MIVNGSTVELTKIHYYESFKRGRNLEIPTISREVFDNKKNSLIRRNVFGQRWTLKINEKRRKRSKLKISVYLLLSACLLIAVVFGIYVTVSEKNFTRKNSTEKKKSDPTRILVVREDLSVEDILNRMKGNQAKSEYKLYNQICNCKKYEVCLKVSDLGPPKCLRASDLTDPSGCGGLCLINTQYCKKLDKRLDVHECTNNTNLLQCPREYFTCGDLCIHLEKRCDGFLHCTDGSDELNCKCDLEKNFQCGNETSCLEKRLKCDGKVDCWDSSDEMDCKNGCRGEKVPCPGGTLCISRNQICDGRRDCADGSDEPEGCISQQEPPI